MLMDQLTELLGHREITVQPVIDLNHAHSVSAYEHPTLIKHRTLLRMLGDVFPHSTNTGYRCAGPRPRDAVRRSRRRRTTRPDR